MKIASITLRNFRRFGDSPTTVELAEDITALVGANGSGKTALLTALNRLFGTTQNMRTMRRSDFHWVGPTNLVNAMRMAVFPDPFAPTRAVMSSERSTVTGESPKHLKFRSLIDLTFIVWPRPRSSAWFVG